jgi:hypothetical protein
MKENPANLNAVECLRIEFLRPSGRDQRFLNSALT